MARHPGPGEIVAIDDRHRRGARLGREDGLGVRVDNIDIDLRWQSIERHLQRTDLTEHGGAECGIDTAQGLVCDFVDPGRVCRHHLGRRCRAIFQRCRGLAHTLDEEIAKYARKGRQEQDQQGQRDRNGGNAPHAAGLYFVSTASSFAIVIKRGASKG